MKHLQFIYVILLGVCMSAGIWCIGWGGCMICLWLRWNYCLCVCKRSHFFYEEMVDLLLHSFSFLLRFWNLFDRISARLSFYYEYVLEFDVFTVPKVWFVCDFCKISVALTVKMYSCYAYLSVFWRNCPSCPKEKWFLWHSVKCWICFLSFWIWCCFYQVVCVYIYIFSSRTV